MAHKTANYDERPASEVPYYHELEIKKERGGALRELSLPTTHRVFLLLGIKKIPLVLLLVRELGSYLKLKALRSLAVSRLDINCHPLKPAATLSKEGGRLIN